MMQSEQNDVQFIEKMDFQDYLKLPNMGSTKIKTLLENPFAVDNKMSEKDCLQTGRAFHAYVLERPNFDKIMGYKILDVKNFMTNDAKEQKEAAFSQGLTPIIQSKYEEQIMLLDKMTASIDSSKNAIYSLTGGKPETSFLTSWHGIPVKARIDYLKIDGDTVYCVDLKSISVQSHRTFGLKEVENYSKRYQLGIQAAFYTNIIQLYFGKEMKVKFRHVFVEKPLLLSNVSHAICTEMCDESIHFFSEKVDKALHEYSLGEQGESLEDWIITNQRDEFDIVDESELDIISIY